MAMRWIGDVAASGAPSHRVDEGVTHHDSPTVRLMNQSAATIALASTVVYAVNVAGEHAENMMSRQLN